MNKGEKRRFKDDLYEQFARIGKALSSGRRLELLELLAQRERTVEELAAETCMSVANCSQHLQVLRGAQIVDVRRDGLYARYWVADESVLRFWLSLRALGEARLRGNSSHRRDLPERPEVTPGNYDRPTPGTADPPGRCRTRCSAGGGVRYGPYPGGALDSSKGARRQAERASQEQRGYRLLPRALLRVRR